MRAIQGRAISSRLAGALERTWFGRLADCVFDSDNISWPKRGPNDDRRIGSTMPREAASVQKGPATEPVPRESSQSVAALEAACHARGRGFESSLPKRGRGMAGCLSDPATRFCVPFAPISSAGYSCARTPSESITDWVSHQPRRRRAHSCRQLADRGNRLQSRRLSFFGRQPRVLTHGKGKPLRARSRPRSRRGRSQAADRSEARPRRKG